MSDDPDASQGTAVGSFGVVSGHPAAAAAGRAAPDANGAAANGAAAAAPSPEAASAPNLRKRKSGEAMPPPPATAGRKVRPMNGVVSSGANGISRPALVGPPQVHQQEKLQGHGAKSCCASSYACPERRAQGACRAPHPASQRQRSRSSRAVLRQAATSKGAPAGSAARCDPGQQCNARHQSSETPHLPVQYNCKVQLTDCGSMC